MYVVGVIRMRMGMIMIMVQYLDDNRDDGMIMEKNNLQVELVMQCHQEDPTSKGQVYLNMCFADVDFDFQ